MKHANQENHCMCCPKGPEQINLREKIPGLTRDTWVCVPCWNELQEDRELSQRHQKHSRYETYELVG